MNGGRIVITGANGFTGRHACAHFASRGFEVVAVVRRPGLVQAPEPGPAGGRVIEAVCSLDHTEPVEQLLAAWRPQFVLHLAGRNAVAESWREPMAFVETNVVGTLRLLDALRRVGLTGCRTVVAGSMLRFALGSSCDGDEPPAPPHPYSFSKTVQTLAARAWGSLFGLPVMIAQPSNLIGPGRSAGICGLLADRIARAEAGLEEPVFRLSSATEARDFVDVRDAVRAYECILRRGEAGAVYGIGSGRARTLGELAERMRALSALPQLRYVIGEADAPPPEPVDTRDLQALGWRAEVPFGQSMGDILAFYREQYKA